MGTLGDGGKRISAQKRQGKAGIHRTGKEEVIHSRRRKRRREKHISVMVGAGAKLWEEMGP